MDWLTWWNEAVAYLDAHAGAITGIATVVIALFTIALAASTKKLWKEAKVASGIAQTSAEAAKAAAETAERQLRAYISVEFTNVRKLGTEAPIEYSFDIKNVGQTPAYNVTAFTDVFVDKHPLPPSIRKYDLSQCIVAPGGSANVIGPNLSNSSYGTAKETMDQRQFGAICGGSRLYIRGVVVYKDFRSTERHTWFGTCIGGPRFAQEVSGPPDASGKRTITHLFEHVGQLNDAD